LIRININYLEKNMFRFLTCGESHGKMLSAILEGLPAGLDILESEISIDLARRQKGYGRGSRSTSIEKDTAEIISGVRWGKTTGSPIGILIANRDWQNRKEEMSVYPEHLNSSPSITKPRPGHADLAGMLKYNIDDAKPILERASARNTASLVAVGAVCKKFLKQFDVEILGYVKSIGKIGIEKIDIKNFSNELKEKIENSETRCPDEEISVDMMKLIDETKKVGDTLGGEIVLNIFGVVPGLGSHIQYDKRLDAGLAFIMMGIPSVKNVLIGENISSEVFGSEYHDVINYDSKQKKYAHFTNNAGGIEGGMSNGERIDVTISIKPIPTLYKPLETIDIKTKEKVSAEVVRSDVAVAPSAVVVAEAMAAIKLTEFYLEKFGGDSMTEILANFKNYKYMIGNR
jgi:chorismate synthase